MTPDEFNALTAKIKAAAKISVTIEVSAVTLLRVLVWGKARDGRSAEAMLAAIVADRAGNRDNLKEALSGAALQAGLVGCSTPDYIRALLREADIQVEGVNLADLPDSILYAAFGVGAADVFAIDPELLRGLEDSQDED